MAEGYYNQFIFFFKNKYNLRFFFIGVLIMLVLSYIIDIKPILFLIVLCALNIILLIYDRYVQVPIDIELSTLSAVIMTLKFGLNWGIAAGVLTKVAVMISNSDFNSNSIVSLTAYSLVAVLANLFRGLPFFYLGILVAVLVNIYIMLFSRFILFMSTYETVMYSASNVFFNIFFFVIFANFTRFIGI